MNPFIVSDDPRFLYQTESLNRAIHSIHYLADSQQGFGRIWGGPGAGVSTLLRFAHDELNNKPQTVCLMLPGPVPAKELPFGQYLALQLGCEQERTAFAQWNRLKSFFRQRTGEEMNTILLVDNAGRLNPSVLTHLKTLLIAVDNASGYAVQIILAGLKRELSSLLDRKGIESVRSRMAITVTIDPFAPDETQAAIAHRCQVAGVPNPFTAAQIDRVHTATGGVPGDVVRLCGMAYALHHSADTPMPDAIMTEALTGYASQGQSMP